MSQLVLLHYVWVRAKQFGCHSVIPSVCYPGIHFEAVRRKHHCAFYSHRSFFIAGYFR